MKVGDYVISQVRLKDGNLDELYTHEVSKVESNGNYTFKSGQWLTESDVMAKMPTHAVWTVEWNYKTRIWNTGKRVIIVKPNFGKPYLKTEPDHTVENNLLNLIQYKS